MPPPAELVADKGYDSQKLRERLVERGTEPVIPPRKNRKIQYGLSLPADGRSRRGSEVPLGLGPRWVIE